MESLPQHLETRLGTIQRGWTHSPTGQELPFQIIECAGGQIPDVTAFSTLGLSHRPLLSTSTGRLIRHELVMLGRRAQRFGGLPNVLQQVGLEALNTNSAYLRGETIGPRGQLFDVGAMEALYCSVPVYYDDSFAAYEGSDGDAVAIVWLIPISRPECTFVREHGWTAFESLLVDKDPDLIDLERPSIV